MQSIHSDKPKNDIANKIKNEKELQISKLRKYIYRFQNQQKTKDKEIIHSLNLISFSLQNIQESQISHSRRSCKRRRIILDFSIVIEN